MEGLKIWRAEHDFRVRYAETDNMGIAYHANYLVWFEMGRTELMRTHGLSYHAIEEQGVILPVVKAELNYRKSALYDDLVRINTSMTMVSRVTVQLDYYLTRLSNSELLADGYTRHCFLKTDTHKLIRIPGFFRRHFQWESNG